MSDAYRIPRTNQELSNFFERERPRNINYLRGHYKLSREDAEDVYQDSCIALFNNIHAGKLVTLTARLSTYFTQLCVFQTLKKLRDTHHMESLDTEPYDMTRIDALLSADGGFTVRQQRLMESLVRNLPEPCNRILWDFYYENMTMAEIAPRVGFKGADSVKAKKFQCISKFKARVNQRIKDEFYD